ncbi:porin, partial [Salmonella enterica]|uniref:porin n=1 Tax=Salmonella enterica TaxID=28901 RepID=UPI000B1CBF89
AYTDNYMTSRAGGLLAYRHSGFFCLGEGFSFGIQYPGKNQDNHSINFQNGSGVSYPMAFELDGFYDTAPYYTSKRTNEHTDND